MIKSYFKLAWRNLVKGKLYSVINITGLAVGIACCLLIGLYVYEELRYDHFHTDSDRIYRVNMVFSDDGKTKIGATTPRPLAPFLRDQFPEVENVTSIEYESGVIRSENELFETSFVITDHYFFEIFDFEVLQGNPFQSMQNPNAVFLSSSVALQLFGESQAVGKSIDLRIEGNFYPVTVAGIVKDAPSFEVVGVVKNFHFQSLHQEISPLIIYPMDYFTKIYMRVNSEHLSKAISKAEAAWKQAAPGIPFQFSFLDDQIEKQYQSDLRWTQIIQSASVIAILLSCMGLFGLTTLSSTKRSKEIDIRKILGATIPAIVTLISKDFLKPVLLGLGAAIPLSFVFMNWWLRDFAYKIELNATTYFLACALTIVIALVTVSWQSIKAALANPVDSLRSE